MAESDAPGRVQPRFEPGTEIETTRLTLRPFAEADAVDVAAAIDDEMVRWMPWADGYTLDRAVDFCVREAHADQEHAITFAIESAGRLAGSVGLHRADWPSGRVETGYWMAPWARGCAFAPEAARAVAAYAFSRGLHRVELLAAVGNHNSQRVAEKAGFTREAVLREGGRLPGGFADMVLHAFVAGDLDQPSRAAGAVPADCP